MTREDILRELGWPKSFDVVSDLADRVERVVRLAEAAEREACAALIEKIAKSDLITRNDFTHFICKDTAEALSMCIRNKDIFVWPPKNGGNA